MPALVDSTAPLLRRRSTRLSRKDEPNKCKTEYLVMPSTWDDKVPCCVVKRCHHDEQKPDLNESRDCNDTEPETESENDVSSDASSDAGSEHSLPVCEDHHDQVFHPLHKRRYPFLKPSSGDVDILPMRQHKCCENDDSVAGVIESEVSSEGCLEMMDAIECTVPSSSSFTWFRINYVLVMSAIMLADGLQGAFVSHAF